MKQFNLDDIPKYKKKEIKSVEKPKHKHIYEYCLTIDENNRYYPMVYCTICGKLKYNITLCEISEKTDDGCFRLLSQEEIYNKYKHLKQFRIKDMFQKRLEGDKL